MEGAHSVPWYRDFFDLWYRDAWLAGPSGEFVTEEQTEAEIAFITEKLHPEPGAPVLDLGCGQGRHTLALAALGYTVTGLDLSVPLLSEAARGAVQSDAKVQLVRGDMRCLPFAHHAFDVVLSIFTSFGYFEERDDDFKVLRGVAGVLKPGGQLLLDVMDREHTLAHLSEEAWWRTKHGTVVVERRYLDLPHSTVRTEGAVLDAGGGRGEVGQYVTSLRLYSAAELVDMLARAGLRSEGLWGDFAGWEYCFGSERLIVVSRKV